MIRRWELALFALLGGVSLGEAGCGGSVYGPPYDDVDVDCTCTVPCGEGDRTWQSTYSVPVEHVDYVTADAERDCQAAAPDHCAEAPVDFCTCTCEVAD